MNEMEKYRTSAIEELAQSKELCRQLLETPHYKKMGPEGIFAIVQKANSVKINPLEALNGGMYFVNGKVEMSSSMMMQLVRQAGHSVTKDKRSDDTVCILHGKRRDNGDTWTESFSVEDAKRAGIYRNMWEKYPRNMLFARALSNLCRQLFTDVIKGCYVEGEIMPIETSPVVVEEVPADVPRGIGEELAAELQEKLGPYPSLREKLHGVMEQQKISSYAALPHELYEKILSAISKEASDDDS